MEVKFYLILEKTVIRMDESEDLTLFQLYWNDCV